MFQTLIKLLTATTFVAHGLLGCCWHHTHSHVIGAERTVAERGGCHGHGHRHAHHCASERATDTDDHGNRNSDAPHDPVCNEEHCVFARTQDSVKSTADIPPALVPFLLADFPLAGSVLVVSDSQGFAALRETLPLPAPLHALRQVWLI